MFIIGAVDIGSVWQAPDEPPCRLGRAINPVIYREGEFIERLLAENGIVGRVLDPERIWLVGDEESLRALAPQAVALRQSREEQAPR